MECQIGIVVAPVFKKQDGNLTVCRLTVRINHPRALISAFVSTTEGADLPKMEFFNAVARLKPSLTELSYALDQGGQMRVHRWFFPLSIDGWREQKLVLP
jgi:hypothetical protein